MSAAMDDPAPPPSSAGCGPDKEPDTVDAPVGDGSDKKPADTTADDTVVNPDGGLTFIRGGGNRK